MSFCHRFVLLSAVPYIHLSFIFNFSCMLLLLCISFFKLYSKFKLVVVAGFRSLIADSLLTGAMMVSKSNAEHEFVEHMSRWMPKFQDVFDEETFYIFVFVLLIVSIIFAVVMSRFYTIRDAGHID